MGDLFGSYVRRPEELGAFHLGRPGTKCSKEAANQTRFVPDRTMCR